MAINSTHPKYDKALAAWEMMRDSYEGEERVKEQGFRYLPATPGQLLDGMDPKQPGYIAYEAYKLRAVFPDYVSDAVDAYMGMLHQNPPNITLPSKMQSLLKNATIDGEDMNTLLRRINEQQLITGRVGLLADLPFEPDLNSPMPYITMYIGEAIINWDDSNDDEGKNSLNLVVLDESGYERDHNFVWVYRQKYRVLELGDIQKQNEGVEPEDSPEQVENERLIETSKRTYSNGLFFITEGGGEPTQESMSNPTLRGETLDEIPFVFINSKDIVADPDKAPLKGLAEVCMTIYRGEADYRHHLFMQGQDTLVVIGGLTLPAEASAQVRVGAGARLDLNMGGDAKYVGVNSVGLSETRQALENDKLRAKEKSSILAAGKSGMSGRESGESLRIRMAAQTATLRSIALSGASGLEKILKSMAKWMGENPDDVTVTPNLEFSDFDADGKQFVDLMTFRTMGGPISLASIHKVMVDRGVTEMTFEDETDLIEEEDAGRPWLNPAQMMAGQALPLPAAVPGAPAAPAPSPSPAPTPAPKPGKAPASA